MRCECEECNGTGKVTCSECDGRGDVEIDLENPPASTDPEILQLLKDASYCRLQAGRLCQLNPDRAHIYREQLRDILSDLNKKSTKLNAKNESRTRHIPSRTANC